jgi:hypothetical protein
MWWAEGKPLVEAVGIASQYYFKKYASKANTCYVNPVYLTDKKEADDILREYGISILTTKSILKNTLWMGIE